MRRMKPYKWIVFLSLAVSVTGISLCRAQETFAYRSTVRDSVTRKGLPEVYIFAGTDSTGGVRSGADGAFRLKVRKGETVRFRKAGYRWLNVEAAEAGAKPLEMVPSRKTADGYDQFEEVEVNGKLVSEEAYADVNPDYITFVSVSEIGNKKYRLIIKTK